MQEELAFKDVFYLDRYEMTDNSAWMLLMPEIPADRQAIAPLLGLKISFDNPDFSRTNLEFLYGKEILVASIKDHEAILRVWSKEALVSFSASYVRFEINEFNEESFADLERQYRDAAAQLVSQFNALKLQLGKTLEIGHQVVQRAASHTELSGASIRQYHRQFGATGDDKSDIALGDEPVVPRVASSGQQR